MCWEKHSKATMHSPAVMLEEKAGREWHEQKKTPPASGGVGCKGVCLLHYEFDFYHLSVVATRQGGYVETGRQGLDEVDLQSFSGVGGLIAYRLAEHVAY